jgi:apolipoprotein N-acyltransferase
VSDPASVPQAASHPGRTLAVAAAALAFPVLFTLLWPPFGVAELSWVAIAPLTAIAVLVRRGWLAFLLAFAAAVPAWTWLEAWLWGLTPPGTVSLVIFCSSFAGLYAWTLGRLVRSRRFGNWPLAALAPVAWCGVEFLRSDLVLGGYGWFPLGLATLGPPDAPGNLAGGASLLGWSFVSGCCAATGGLAVDLAVRRRDAVRGMRGFAAAATVAMPFVLVAHGRSWSGADAPAGPAVVLVQTDLPMSNKLAWSRDDQLRDIPEFIQLTFAGRRAARDAGLEPDLFVWPETTLPGFGLEPETVRTLVEGGYWPGSIFSDAIADLARELDRPMLVGSNAYLGLAAVEGRWTFDRQFNSVYLVDGEVPFPRYDKLLLTPFGEEMPLISRWDWLEERLLAIGAPGMAFDLHAGERPVRFEIPFRGESGKTRVARVATPICFEDSVPKVCRRLAFDGGERRAELLVNLSNDGWLLDSQMAREHHVLHARGTALALRTPMLRAANTGLSVAISADGRITHRIGEGTAGQGERAGTLAVRPALGTGTPLFARIGDTWSILCLALLTVALLLSRGTPRS